MVRMIKLFGWEKKMQRKISSKRDDELRWIRTTKIFETIIDNLKCAVFSGLLIDSNPSY